jgi:hypothetical protein
VLRDREIRGDETILFLFRPFRASHLLTFFTQGGAIPFGNRFPWAPLISRRWRVEFDGASRRF